MVVSGSESGRESESEPHQLAINYIVMDLWANRNIASSLADCHRFGVSSLWQRWRGHTK